MILAEWEGKIFIFCLFFFSAIYEIREYGKMNLEERF